jgi:putative acetyltransferase
MNTGSGSYQGCAAHLADPSERNSGVSGATFDEALRVIEERTHHRVGIRKLNRAAFGGHDEENLVDRLRKEGDVLASMVAVIGNGVLGHVMFSRLEVGGSQRTISAAALAPMAVLPDRQRQGIGTRLVMTGLALCRSRGVDAVFVLGHPGYYPRFGFSAEKARSVTAPFSGDAFMALEIRRGVLASGLTLDYPPAFGLDQKK